MMIIKELYDYFFGTRRSKEYIQRRKYLVKISRYELIESSLPVFIAAGISGSAAVIIKEISEEKEWLEIFLTATYALTSYFMGKWLTYCLLKDEESNSEYFIFISIRKYKLSKLIRHALAELSGFAWKEFFIVFCLKKIYLEYNLGASFGSWLLIITVALIAIYFSSIIQRFYFKFDYIWNQKMLNFDTESFALSIAYILTSIIVLGFWKIGFAIVYSNSILLDWNEDFADEHHSETESVGTTFLYSFLVAMIVSAVQLPEIEDKEVADEVCIVRPSMAVGATVTSSSNIHTLNPLGSSNHNSFEVDNTTTTPVSPNHSSSSLLWGCIDNDTALTCSVLWNEFLGYTAGVSYFLVIMEACNFPSAYKILPALLIAFIMTNRGPSILAKLRIDREEAERLQSTTTTTQTQPGSTHCWDKASRWLRSYYGDLSLKRKGVMMVSIRLTVGWLWEVVVQDAFEMLGDTEHLESYQAVLVELTFALTLLLIVLAVHMSVRNWDADAVEEQCALDANNNTVDESNSSGSRNNHNTAINLSKTHTNNDTPGINRNNTDIGDFSTISV